MIEEIPLEDTPDFEYRFESVVRLQEFEVYHMGLGLYRLEHPLICSEGAFRCLETKYPYLNFFYIRRAKDIKLLFVMSAVYNITNTQIMENALRKDKFANMIPRGYDEDIDLKLNGEIGSLFIESSYSGYYVSDIDQSNMLLGFRWEPEQYYDLYGRRRYIMIGGCVAKLIATGLYAFQGVRLNDSDDVSRERYPLIAESLCVESCVECAIIGKPHFSGGSISVYEGIDARYIAFDEAGIKSLKILYQCTIGYEYQKVRVTLKDPGPSTNVWQSDEMEYCQTQQKQEDMYELESGAEELLPGIGFEKIRIHNRILFHRDARVFKRPRCYDFAYRKNDFVKLVEISRKGTRVYSIPQKVFAELYVVQRLQLCLGVMEDILIKVIDHTDLERRMLGSGHYETFFQFMKEER